jgi:hypothetical protein
MNNMSNMNNSSSLNWNSYITRNDGNSKLSPHVRNRSNLTKLSAINQ